MNRAANNAVPNQTHSLLYAACMVNGVKNENQDIRAVLSMPSVPGSMMNFACCTGPRSNVSAVRVMVDDTSQAFERAYRQTAQAQAWLVKPCLSAPDGMCVANIVLNKFCTRPRVMLYVYNNMTVNPSSRLPLSRVTLL